MLAGVPPPRRARRPRRCRRAPPRSAPAGRRPSRAGRGPSRPGSPAPARGSPPAPARPPDDRRSGAHGARGKAQRAGDRRPGSGNQIASYARRNHSGTTAVRPAGKGPPCSSALPEPSGSLAALGARPCRAPGATAPRTRRPGRRGRRSHCGRPRRSPPTPTGTRPGRTSGCSHRGRRAVRAVVDPAVVQRPDPDRLAHARAVTSRCRPGSMDTSPAWTGFLSSRSTRPGRRDPPTLNRDACFNGYSGAGPSRRAAALALPRAGAGTTPTASARSRACRRAGRPRS